MTVAADPIRCSSVSTFSRLLGGGPFAHPGRSCRGARVSGRAFWCKHSVSLAKDMGISEAVIGLTIVAAGTSMPELATSLVAALRKQPDNRDRKCDWLQRLQHPWNTGSGNVTLAIACSRYIDG